MPLGGFSSHDSPQGHLYEPGPPPVFAAALKKSLNGDVPMATVPHHITGPEFVEALVQAVLELADAG